MATGVRESREFRLKPVIFLLPHSVPALKKGNNIHLYYLDVQGYVTVEAVKQIEHANWSNLSLASVD